LRDVKQSDDRPFQGGVRHADGVDIASRPRFRAVEIAAKWCQSGVAGLDNVSVQGELAKVGIRSNNSIYSPKTLTADADLAWPGGIV
jgi:hypothetical protein